MKILWVAPHFLHPATKGGHIRTLGILRCLARHHEVHYAAYADPAHPEGPARAGEYSFRAYPVRHVAVDKGSPAFLAQLAGGMFSPLPLTVIRYRSPRLKRFLEELIGRERFDRLVIDFLNMTASSPQVECAVLFQHNVETMIWRRHAEHARNPLRKLFFQHQAKRVFTFERDACLKAGRVAAVSKIDADLMRELFGATRVSEIPTGVDVEYFTPRQAPRTADLVFVGSMDWLPNIDGVTYFAEQILPRIRARRPDCSVAIVGRTPPPAIQALARQDARLQVTGTVPDVRPYLWGAAVSIVPLRIGGGTRLKIYEAMAAGTPVVSTTVGAEGLAVHPPEDIRIADDPRQFAAECLSLLEDSDASRRVADAARARVVEHFSWDHVARVFAEVVRAAPALAGRSACTQ